MPTAGVAPTVLTVNEASLPTSLWYAYLVGKPGGTAWITAAWIAKGRINANKYISIRWDVVIFEMQV
jgi:hypothetical protein